MSNPFRLGFLTHFEGEGDARQIYEETLQLFVAADELGFNSAWIAQHHFKDRVGRLPSPLPFLAAAAQRTQRLHLGTAVVVLPFEHPIRLAEDAAVVDTLSGGRLELGVGSGGDPAEFAIFDLDIEQRRELTSGGLQRVQRALQGEPLSAAGLTLQPSAPALAGRLWQSVYGAAGAEYAARHGVGLLINRAAYESEEPSDLVQAPWAEAYLRAWNGRVATPRVGLSRGIYIAEDRRTALAELREGVLRSAESMVRAGRFPAGLSLEQYCERLYIAYGDPEQVAARLAADRVLPYATELIVQFNPASPPLHTALHMLEQVATEVAPALGWRPDLQPVAVGTP